MKNIIAALFAASALGMLGAGLAVWTGNVGAGLTAAGLALWIDLSRGAGK